MSAPAASEKRPLARAILTLVALGAFFYASYGFSNWLADTRKSVPSIVFEWERKVPFLDWTILPYWSTNLFYAASILLSRTRLELDVHAKRLLTAQLVAVFFFIVMPLKFSWPKPETAGFFGFMFDALGAFDKPFNQAPSLHVALTILFIARFADLLPRKIFAIFLTWSVLVVASVMTTFQHHFIDIPTGALLGFFSLWLWRDDGSNALAGWQLTRDPDRRRLGVYYGLGGLAAAALAITLGGAWLWLFWPALALVGVSIGYFGLGSSVYMKAANGLISWPARIMLAPYLAGAWLNSRIWTRAEAPTVAIAGDVHIGRFPDTATVKRFATIIDLTAELPAPGHHSAWLCFPMLDLVAPDIEALRLVALKIDASRNSGPVLVCCALGYGRSAAAIIVWLVQSGRAADANSAISILRAQRPRVSITRRQMQTIEGAIHGQA